MKSCRFVMVLGMLVVGCGKRSAGPPVVATLPIQGRVTLDGKPLAGADVVFMPVDAPLVFAGTTKEDGSYQLAGLAGKATCKGNCRVTISRMLKPDGSPPPPGEPPAISFAVESLPPRYSMANSTELSANVPEGGGTFNFPLKSK
ncbi:MAG TPA: carboxypeptidase-like regulatory domain-containing protein [Pirellulales bacterium]|nr:carboxypeptidase-like regulatory domain-containing protein [Pirellulales bacterium]